MHSAIGEPNFGILRAGQKGEVNSEDFRLPFEHEWEYAARGGI